MSLHNITRFYLNVTIEDERETLFLGLKVLKDAAGIKEGNGLY